MIKAEKWVLAVLLPLIVLLCIGIYSMKDRDWDRVQSVDGVCDLTGVDFEGGRMALTDGDVEYVAGQLLTPEEFAALDEIRLGSAKEIGPALTSRLRIRVPENRVYAFCASTANYSSRIYVNGALLDNYGVPGLTKETSVPGERFIIFTAQPVDGVIEIVQQSSNFVFWENSRHTAWTVGEHERVLTHASRYQNTYYTVMGCFLILFLTHLILFLILRSYRANLYFALLCLVWVVRTGVIGPKAMFSILPGLPWSAAFRLEYLALPLALILFVLAYSSLFPGLIQKWPRVAACSLGGGFAAFFLLSDTYTMSLSIRYLEIVMILTGLYIAVRLIQKLRRPSLEQIIVLLGFAVALAGLVLDSVYYSLGPFAILVNAVSESSLLIVSLFQITAMLFGTMRRAGHAWKREQALALKNEALDRENIMKRELLANLSHEMRTPLAVMSVYAQLTVGAIRDGTVDEQTTGDLDTIAKEAKRLAEMASGVMDLFSDSQLQERHAAFSLSSLMRQLAGLCRPMVEKGNNTLTLRLSEELPSAWGDPNRCTQLVWNLLSNSCAHTHDGEIIIEAVPEGNLLAVTVTDTGEGIDPALLPRVLDRGVSSTQGGHGLGLALCRQIVDEHGGSISIKSQPGKGTSVRFTLPACQEQ